MVDEILPEPILPRPSRRRGVWIVALAGFALGLGMAGWLGWRSGADYPRLLGLAPVAAGAGAVATAANGGGVRPAYTAPAASIAPADAIPDRIALAGRLAAVEQRMDRIDAREAAAAGNAARAEALLVAFAARRVVERGAPLGYLAEQLRLRFGAAQPDAVATIIAGARDQVPLDQLAARLEALAPQLMASGRQTMWNRFSRGLAELFVIRRDRPALSDADARMDDARRALAEGRIDAAIADVDHLSQGADAAGWSAAARRYRDLENALDLIDATALLQPRQVRDAAGDPVDPALP